jgi:hypothetical protein
VCSVGVSAIAPARPGRIEKRQGRGVLGVCNRRRATSSSTASPTSPSSWAGDAGQRAAAWVPGDRTFATKGKLAAGTGGPRPRLARSRWRPWSTSLGGAGRSRRGSRPARARAAWTSTRFAPGRLGIGGPFWPCPRTRSSPPSPWPNAPCNARTRPHPTDPGRDPAPDDPAHQHPDRRHPNTPALPRPAAIHSDTVKITIYNWRTR